MKIFNVPKGLEEYVEPGYLVPSDDFQMVKLAKHISKGAKTPEQAAKKLFKYVRDGYRWNARSVIDSKELVNSKNKEALCTNKAALYVTLLRALNIPARFLMLTVDMHVMTKELPVKTNHVASEIYINKKWIVSDPGYGPASKNIIKTSQFSTPSWTNPRKVKTLTNLNKFFIKFFLNNLIKYSPIGKQIKKVVAKDKLREERK